MSGQGPPSIYEFGAFELDATRRSLRFRDGRPVPLTPRVFETLLCLVEHAGNLIEKSTLLEAVWPHVVVEEGSLAQAIYELRRALGERPDEHRYIVTVPGRGYQFVAEVTRRERTSTKMADAQPPEVASPPDGPTGVPSPDHSPPLASTWRAPSERLLARVVAKGRGALPRRHARFLVAAFALASASIAAWYGVDMRASDPSATKATTANPRAHEHFQLARFFAARRHLGDLRRAEQEYRHALELDPDFARAWAGLSGVYYVSLDRYDFELSRVEALARMRAAVDRALALDPNLAEAHVRRAMYQLEAGDHEGGREHVRRAAALEPNNPLVLFWLSEIALSEGRLDDAVEFQRDAVRQNPLALVTRANLGTNLYFAGRFDEATTELRTALQLAGAPDAAWGNPNDPSSAAGISLAKALMAQRRYDEALALIRSWPPGQLRDSCLAQVHHARGEGSEADAALQRLVSSVTAEPHWIAETYAHRGDVDQAFRWIAIAAERSRERHDGRQTWRMDIRYSPFVTSLHGDRRWKAWLAENR